MRVPTVAGRLASTILAALWMTSGASAQNFPTRPLEFIVHTSPGGGTDLFARAVAEMIKQQKLLPQPIQVVNRPGGSGTIAFNHVRARRGDPHTVLTVATGSLLTATTRPDQDLGLAIYTPLAFFALDPQAVTVHADSKFATFRDLIEAARREPNTITCSVASAGGTGRLTLFLIERATGAKFRYVAFKSGGDAVLQVLGGHVQFTTENASEAFAQFEAKKLRFIGVTAERRLPSLPEVPTLAEIGYPVYVGTGRGFAMPAGVPKEAAAYLEGVLRKVHDSKAWKEHALKNMFEDRYLNGEEFGAYLVKRRVEMQEFVQAIGLGRK